MDISIDTVSVEKTVTVEEKQVTLTLTEDEAAALHALVGCVTGRDKDGLKIREEVTSPLFAVTAPFRNHPVAQSTRDALKSGNYGFTMDQIS